MKNNIVKYSIYLSVLVVLTLVDLGVYFYYVQNLNLKSIRNELASTTEAYQQDVQLLRSNLLAEKNTNTDLHGSLQAEQARNDQFSNQVESLSTVVGQLYKLSKTDKELLQKYSKIYFLNENYIPSQLSEIDQIFLLRKTKPEQIHTNIKPYIENMMRAASSSQISLLVLSAYRSFGTQATLKTNYKITYGTTAANKFSADQGYSEHQLGSTADFSTDTIGENLAGFDKTKSFEWMTQNAYKYGFTMSYPKGNKYFQYEPWHWRFVGVELATKLYNENKYFYDIDQRTINDYLIKIFD